MRTAPALAVVVLVGLLTTASAAPPLADLFTDPAPYDEVPVPWNFSEPSPRIAAEVDAVDDAYSSVVLALESPDGDPLLYLAIDHGVFRVSDGYQADGITPRPLLYLTPTHDRWYHVDIHVKGDTYVLDLDAAPVVEGRTFHHATTGQLADPASMPYEPGHDARVYNLGRVVFYPEETASTTFADPLPKNGWTAHATQGATARSDPAMTGQRSGGTLRVQVDPNLPTDPDHDLAYAHRSGASLDGTYLVEGWARPRIVSSLHLDGIPDHQAVLAGLSGPVDDPTVHWAIVQAQLGLEHDRWGLFLIGPDDSRTQLTPRLLPNDPYWHQAAVLVDETAGTLTVQIDLNDTAQRFTVDDLGTAERIATGDIWVDHPHWTGAGTGFYDNVVLHPWEVAS